MHDTTAHTRPRSHSKVLQSFRTAACQTRRTDLGRTTFIDIHEHSAVPQGFIAEHGPQRTPSGIQHGFRHPRSCQCGAADVADNDQSIVPNESSRDQMQIVAPPVDDFRVDRFRPLVSSSPLRFGQRHCMLLHMPRIFDVLTVRTRRERLQAQVNSNFEIGRAHV